MSLWECSLPLRYPAKSPLSNAWRPLFLYSSPITVFPAYGRRLSSDQLQDTIPCISPQDIQLCQVLACSCCRCSRSFISVSPRLLDASSSGTLACDVLSISSALTVHEIGLQILDPIASLTYLFLLNSTSLYLHLIVPDKRILLSILFHLLLFCSGVAPCCAAESSSRDFFFFVILVPLLWIV